MNLLQSILNCKPPLFSLRIGLILSTLTLLSTTSFADNPAPLTSNGDTSEKTIPTITAMPPMALSPQSSQMQAPRYYYSPQQQQYYQAMPYGYYYPQQHPSTYMPRQGNNYPQQQFTPPYYPYPVTASSLATQRNAYSYPQTRSFPNPPAANTISNKHSTARYPMRKKIKKKKYAWGDERHIWPDFYTDFTGDAWDNMLNAPYKAGRMPGGWRAPSLSTPDPVTVSDAVTNQLPPIMEEMGNMTNFSN